MGDAGLPSTVGAAVGRERFGAALSGPMLTLRGVAVLLVATIVLTVLGVSPARAADDSNPTSSASPTSGPTEEPAPAASASSTASPAASADEAESGDAAAESVDLAPIVVVSGSLELSTKALSATTMRVTGEATFRSTGDVESLGGEGLTATITYRFPSGSTVVREADAILTEDGDDAQLWTVPVERELRSRGTVTVELGGQEASATYAKVHSGTGGWAASTAITRTAGKSWSRDVRVTNAYGRKVRLQVWIGDGWRTVKAVRTEDKRVDTVTFRFKGGDDTWYSNDWNTFRFRVVVQSSRAIAEARSRTLKVKPAMRYEAAAGYLQPVTSITSPSGGYTLRAGRNGNKVKRVQYALGLGSRWETMDSVTVSRVKQFQESHGLKVTGDVNKATWVAMGLSADSWYSLGDYTHEVVADRSSTRKERIEIMIDTAMEYVGSDYVWGGAGTPAPPPDLSTKE